MPDAPPTGATVLGFDVGARRIGVAVGSGFGLNARPLAVVDVHDGAIDWKHVEKLHREWRPAGFIVGDPMTMDGGDQPIRDRAKAFARALHERFGLPVAMMDERNTSQEAARRFAADRADGKRRRRDADLLDAVAAAIILDRWITMPQDATPIAPQTAASTDVPTDAPAAPPVEPTTE
jgi:putative Holliday junction resolvase